MHLDTPPEIRVPRELDVRLDDWHQSRLLAQCSEPCQGLCVGIDRHLCGQKRASGSGACNGDAPFAKPGPSGPCGLELGEEPVEAVGEKLEGGVWERGELPVCANAGDDIFGEEGRGEMECEEGFGVEDYSGDGF